VAFDMERYRRVSSRLDYADLDLGGASLPGLEGMQLMEGVLRRYAA
jgi:hypothetical protein